MRHETGLNAVMVCAAYSDKKHSFLAAGQESYCQLYNVGSVIVYEKEDIETIGNDENHVRHRGNKTNHNNNKAAKKLKFVIKPADSVKTDFNDEEPLLRVIRICRTGNLMATGGTDGFVKLWKFPSLQPIHTLKAHKKEIDDIDFSPYENYLISIAKDGTAVLWDYVTGKEVKRLTWNQPKTSKYLYKRCRLVFYWLY